MTQTTPAQPVAEAAPSAPATAPVVPPVAAERSAPSPDAIAEAVKADRERIAALGLAHVASRGLITAAPADALHQKAITEGWSVEAFRSALWDEHVKSAAPATRPNRAEPDTGTEASASAQRMIAIANRAAPRPAKEA